MYNHREASRDLLLTYSRSVQESTFIFCAKQACKIFLKHHHHREKSDNRNSTRCTGARVINNRAMKPESEWRCIRRERKREIKNRTESSTFFFRWDLREIRARCWLLVYSRAARLFRHARLAAASSLDGNKKGKKNRKPRARVLEVLKCTLDFKPVSRDRDQRGAIYIRTNSLLLSFSGGASFSFEKRISWFFNVIPFARRTMMSQNIMTALFKITLVV